MKDRIRSGNAEWKFLTSLVMVIASVGIIFTFLNVYKPSHSGLGETISIDNNRATQVGRKKPSASRRKNESLRASTPSSFESGDSFARIAQPPSKPKSAQSSERPTDRAALSEQVSSAIELIDSGNAKEAQAILEDVLKLDPKNEQALVELGMIYLIDFRSSQNALSYLERALQVNSANRIVLSELVGIYDELEISDQGLEFLKNVESKSGKNASLDLALGQLLSGQGRTAEAISFLESAAASDANAEFVLSDLADAYSAAGFGDKALSAYKKAVDAEQARLIKIYDSGRSSVGEERLGMLQMDYVRELIRQGQFDAADDLLGEVSDRLPDDDAIAALYDHLNRKRAG